MKKYSIESGFAKISLFFAVLASFIIPTAVFATSTITSVTLNNAATVSVMKNSTITAKVNISYTGSLTWGSTGWRISATSGTMSCNTAASFNNIGNGTNSSSFSITAPNTVGTYNAYFTAYSGNNCNGTAIATKTLTNAVTTTAPTMPDLTVVKTDNVSGHATVGTPFTWTLIITNNGNAPAVFSNTNTILSDNMPFSGVTYGAVSTSTSGTTGNFGCSIANFNVTCVAKATVTIPAGGTLTVVVPVTGTTAGSLINPRTGNGNSCKVDPILHVTESNENNNSCADTVVVSGIIAPVIPGVSITPNTLPGATVGTVYSQILTASTTASGPFTWSVISGTIPAGLTLGTTGTNTTLSGTPSASGTSNFTVKVTNGTSSTTQAYSINAATVVVPPPSGNLILNPELTDATVSSTTPDHWLHAGFDDTFSFAYPVPGVTGAGDRAAQVTITNHTDGDAKWYFAPIPVIPGQQYIFTDSYMSATSTQLAAEFLDANGNLLSFGQWVAVPPTVPNTWQIAKGTFTVPFPVGTSTPVAFMTILHLINHEGTLTTDHYNLTLLPPALPFDTGMVTLSFDDGWLSQYTNALPILQQAGFHGSFYIISNAMLQATPTGNPNILCSDPNQVFCDGATLTHTTSSWSALGNYPDPSKNTYTFSDSYTATTTSTVTVSYIGPNGQPISGKQNIPLITLPVGNNQPATITFTIPADVVALATPSTPISFNLSHSVSAGQTLTVTAPSLTAQQGPEDSYMTSAEVLAMQAAGNEIGAHTEDHCDLLQLFNDPTRAMTGGCASLLPTSKTATEELNGSRSALLAIGATPVDTFAYPYGGFDANVENLVQQDGFIAARSVLLGYNTRANDIYALNTQQITLSVTNSPTGLATVESWIDYAKQNKVWLTLLLHNVETQTQINANAVLDPTSVSDATTDVFFQSVVDYLKNNHVCVVTIHEGALAMKGTTTPCGSVNPPPPANTSPTLQALNNQSVATGTQVTFTAHATDPDIGNVLTYTTAPLPAGATFDTSTGVFLWTPGDSDVGDHTLTVSVSDGNGGTDSKNVTITVTAAATTPVNHTPVAADQTASTTKNTSVNITLAATDADGDVLTYATSTSPSHGTLSGTIPALTYAPDTDFIGTDSFTFTASDATSTSNVATVSITVNATTTTVTTCPTHFTLDVNNICQPDTTAPICPANSTLTGDVCVSANPPTPPTCPDGSTLSNNMCVTPPTDPVCPANTTLTAGQCVTPPTTPTCPADFTFDTPTQQCVSADPDVSPVPATCPDGATLTDSQCVTPPSDPTCPANTTLTSGQCVTPDSTPVCPANTTLTDGQCVTPNSTPTCPAGFALNTTGNLCVASADTVAPIITLNGLSTLNLTVGDTYTEPGATAVDNVDTTTPVTIGGDIVNTAAAGTYTVTYDAVDSSGNHAIQVIRTVIVSAPAPVSPVSSGGGGGGGGGGNGPIVASTQSYGIADFNAIIVNWGKTGFGLPGDLNNDGKVDILDFNLLLINWAK